MGEGRKLEVMDVGWLGVRSADSGSDSAEVKSCLHLLLAHDLGLIVGVQYDIIIALTVELCNTFDLICQVLF